MTVDDKVLELLTEQTDRALTEAERRELGEALAQSGADRADHAGRADDVDLAAAAIALAELEAEGALDNEPMPAALMASLEQAGQAQMIESVVSVTAPRPFEPVSPDPRRLGFQADEGPSAAANDPGPSRWLAYGGWVAAAAAVIALVAGRTGDTVDTPAPNNDALAASGAPASDCEVCPELPVEPPAPSAAEQRKALEAEPEALRLAWANTKDPLAGSAKGDVVWSNAKQEGYMRFEGLPVNDPTKQQYQLWIFDKGRSDKTPVDGGVFNVSAGGEVVVTIDPKVQVDEAVMFAVTVERPGGVVVSQREHIVTLAQVG